MIEKNMAPMAVVERLGDLDLEKLEELRDSPTHTGPPTDFLQEETEVRDH